MTIQGNVMDVTSNLKGESWQQTGFSFVGTISVLQFVDPDLIDTTRVTKVDPEMS